MSVADRQALLDAATPRPWFSFHVDDCHAMNCHGVTTDPDFERKNDYIGGSEAKDAPCREIVALTLYQATRVVCHQAGAWDYDAALISTAVNEYEALLACESSLRALVGFLRPDNRYTLHAREALERLDRVREEVAR